MNWRRFSIVAGTSAVLAVSLLHPLVKLIESVWPDVLGWDGRASLGVFVGLVCGIVMGRMVNR